MYPFIIHARNVNQALPTAIDLLLSDGVVDNSRNGSVLVIPSPVITSYTHPCERVLFSEVRDANPFFHFIESLWMLAGYNDVASIAKFNKRMETFSDDGVVLNGAYGYRWRNYFRKDQLKRVVEILYKDPSSRRVVLSMWSVEDLYNDNTKDVPCNTHIYFDCRGGKLNMTVCNRSNDAVWGCYGANVVHFSVLQEFIAGCLGVPVGMYWQFSNNLHIYQSMPGFGKITTDLHCDNLYEEKEFNPYPLISENPGVVLTYESWLDDLHYFMTYCLKGDKLKGFIHPFFDMVAVPIYDTWQVYKNGDIREAIEEFAPQIKADDWRTDIINWLRRRQANRQAK